MRHRSYFFTICTLALLACLLGGYYAISADEEAATKTNPVEQLEMVLTPDADGKGFRIVAATKRNKFLKHATVVRCDYMRVTKDGAVFTNATVESKDHKTTCSKATLSGEKASIRFSDDLKIRVKTEAAKKQLLKAIKR